MSLPISQKYNLSQKSEELNRFLGKFPSENVKLNFVKLWQKQFSQKLPNCEDGTIFNAAVNGKLELTLLKGRQRFDTVSTSNLKV